MDEDSHSTFKIVQGIVIAGFVLGFLVVIFRICATCYYRCLADGEAGRPVYGNLSRSYGVGQQCVPHQNIYPSNLNSGAITIGNNNCIPIPVVHQDYLPPPHCMNMNDVSRDNVPPPPYFPDHTDPPGFQSTALPPYTPESK